MPTIRKPLLTFLLLTFALSSIFYFLIIKAGHLNAGKGLYVLGLMWCPGLSGIITRLLFKQSTVPMGWRWGKTRYQAAAYLIPVAYATFSYLLIWLTGMGAFYNPKFISNLPGPLSAKPAWLAMTLYVVILSTAGMVSSCFSALGEEIGWRGFLVPNLAQNNGFTRTAVISGLIWSVWHYPILIFADYNSGTPTWYGLSCFTVMVVSIAIVFAWFRLKSGSLWTGVFLHASHNIFIQGFFDPVTRDTGHTRYFIGEFGAVVPLVAAALAFYFWRRRSELAPAGVPSAVSAHAG
jgi:membrane protease YdiL (CAAX protease family)